MCPLRRPKVQSSVWSTPCGQESEVERGAVTGPKPQRLPQPRTDQSASGAPSGFSLRHTFARGSACLLLEKMTR